MAEAVTAENEVSLNAVRYKLSGPVRRSLVSNYPGKTVIGDYTKDSSPILSTLALTDHRGGIGLDIMTGEGDTDRSWYSTAETRYKGHLILPPLVTNTSDLPAGLTQTTHLLAYQGRIFGNVDATTNGVYEYIPDAWTSAPLASGITGVLNGGAVGQINGAAWLVFPTSDGAYATFDGTTWTEVSVTGTGGWMAIWDDRVWNIDSGSPYALMYSFIVSGTWTTLRGTPMALPSAKTGQLFGAKDADGETTLYLATPSGLFVYDLANDKWYPTGLQTPDAPGTVGSTIAASGLTWREDIYFATKSGIFKYSVSGGAATITPIGPDRDNGLPLAKGKMVVAMVASFNDLIVSIRTTSKTSVILAWDGRGWRVLYEGGAALGEILSPLLVSGTTLAFSGGVQISGDYRLFFANNTTSPFNISYLELPYELVNPLQIATYKFAAAATHDWPWFTAGQDDVTKVAVRVKVQTTNPTTGETVKVYYAIDRSSTFQIMTNSTYTNGTITAAGLHTFDFPSVDAWVSTTARTGTAFRSIQFRVVFARGGTTTNTPDVLSLTLEYYKKLDPKYQFVVTLDLNNAHGANTPKQARAALLTAQETGPLVEFTYRDPATNSDATFYVQVQPLEGTEQTGVDERGMSTLRLVEV